MACESDFDEDIENLRKIFTLNKIVSFEINDIKCVPGSSSGDNYMSLVKRVEIHGIRDGVSNGRVGAIGSGGGGSDYNDQSPRNGDDRCSDDGSNYCDNDNGDNDDDDNDGCEDDLAVSNKDIQRLSLIIKRQIPNRTRRQLYRCDEAFYNEINAYKHVVPFLQQYSTDTFFPKCHFAGQDDLGDIIILEDLKVMGYRMQDRLAGLDLNYCQLVMKHLAKLHAASIAAKQLNTETFHEKRKHIREIVFSKEAEEFYRNIMESSIQESLNSLRASNSDGCLTEPIRRIEKLQTKIFGKIQRGINNSKESLNVVCHGDLWINNIMFIVTGEADPAVPSSSSSSSTAAAANGKKATPPTDRRADDVIPCAVKFFDLQVMRYTSPVFDILHFIYTSTKREIREAHTPALLETYCLALTANLRTQFTNAAQTQALHTIMNTFSLENITEEYYQHVLYGLAISMWVLPAVTFDPLDIPNLDEMSERNTNAKEIKCTQKLTPEYHRRLRDLALEFYQNGFLDDCCRSDDSND